MCVRVGCVGGGSRVHTRPRVSLFAFSFAFVLVDVSVSLFAHACL